MFSEFVPCHIYVQKIEKSRAANTTWKPCTLNLCNCNRNFWPQNIGYRERERERERYRQTDRDTQRELSSICRTRFSMNIHYSLCLSLFCNLIPCDQGYHIAPLTHVNVRISCLIHFFVMEASMFSRKKSMSGFRQYLVRKNKLLLDTYM